MRTAQVEAGMYTKTSSHQPHNSTEYVIGSGGTGLDCTNKLSVNTSVAQGRLSHKKLGKHISGWQRMACTLNIPIVAIDNSHVDEPPGCISDRAFFTHRAVWFHCFRQPIPRAIRAVHFILIHCPSGRVAWISAAVMILPICL